MKQLLALVTLIDGLALLPAVVLWGGSSATAHWEFWGMVAFGLAGALLCQRWNDAEA